MDKHAQRKLARQRERDAVRYLTSPYRVAPSKAELREQLAAAVRNTVDQAHRKARGPQAGSPQ